MHITVQNVVCTVFLGVIVVAIWNSPAREAPTGGKSEKNTHWKDPGKENRGYPLEPLGLLPLFNSFALDATEIDVQLIWL